MIRLSFLLLAGVVACSAPQRIEEPAEQNWTHYVRTAGHSLSRDSVDEIIRSATETGVFGIETDNDITGRYASFLDPTEKLRAIEAVAEAARAADNYAYVYIAGLECITDNAAQKEQSFFKDHPGWVQRNLAGEPAVFGGGTAFWIDEGDEDVWISPYARDWRNIYMERVRQIAATGIHGVYVDIPYWMTHFEGWEDTWASFDDHTVAAFYAASGLDARHDLRLEDWRDAAFRRWVDFRIQTITDFMAEIDRNVKEVNPRCKTIAEIYPGYGEDAVRVGADVYRLYEVVDVITHEYSAGGYMAAARDPFDWFTYLGAIHTFRAFAEGKPSWMLSYSWDGEEGVDPREAMQNLAMSQVLAGANFWDARGHVMSGSNDFATRKRIFQWIAQHQERLYRPRSPVDPIGLYFSPPTRDYFVDDFYQAYTGFLHLLQQAHLEFQIVTPRTLRDFPGSLLILPDVRCLDNEEIGFLERFLSKGKRLWLTAETGQYDQTGALRSGGVLSEKLNITSSDRDTLSQAAGKHFLYTPDCPGRRYFQTAGESFNRGAAGGDWRQAPFYQDLQKFTARITGDLGYRPALTVQASPFVATSVARIDDTIYLFLSNFKGLIANRQSVQLPEKGVEISFPATAGTQVYALEFLGDLTPLETVVREDELRCTVPLIRKGMIVWCE